MEIFVHQQNLIYFRQVARAQPNLVRRLQLIKLLADEEAKLRRLAAEQGLAGSDAVATGRSTNAPEN